MGMLKVGPQCSLCTLKFKEHLSWVSNSQLRLHILGVQKIRPKGYQSWIFIGRTDAEVPILWPPDAKSWFIGKDPDAGKDWRREEKGETEDEMVGWHHWWIDDGIIDGHEFEQALGDSEGWELAVWRSGRLQSTRVREWTQQTGTAILAKNYWNHHWKAGRELNRMAEEKRILKNVTVSLVSQMVLKKKSLFSRDTVFLFETEA